MSTQLSQVAKKAKLDRKARVTSLAHLLTPEFLKETWGKMNRRASGGVDGQSAEQFASELETQVEALCKQLKEGIYHAPPVRRVEIPKGPGKIGTRPLGIPTVADRLLQRAVARILEGARCGKSARRLLLGETRSSGHAYSVRGALESVALRQAPHGLPSSRLVSTILLDEWFET